MDWKRKRRGWTNEPRAVALPKLLTGATQPAFAVEPHHAEASRQPEARAVDRVEEVASLVTLTLELEDRRCSTS